MLGFVAATVVSMNSSIHGAEIIRNIQVAFTDISVYVEFTFTYGEAAIAIRNLLIKGQLNNHGII